MSFLAVVILSPALIRIRGYEDSRGQAFWNQWRHLLETSEERRMPYGRDENPPAVSTYYHAIDRTEDIETFTIKEKITAATPYPRGQIMAKLGIYIPSFLLGAMQKQATITYSTF